MHAQGSQPPGQLRERPSPDAALSPWVTAQTTLVAVGRRRKRSLHAASAGSCVRREVPSAAHTSGQCPPSPGRACGRARSCSSARFRPGSRRAPCAAHTSGLCPGFSHVPGALPRPRMLPVCQVVVQAVKCLPALCSPGTGSGLLRPCMPSACAGCVAPDSVGLCLSFPLSRMRVVLRA